MPTTFGVTIVQASGSIVESVDIEMKGEFKQLIDSAGQYSEAKTYDTSYSINAKGKGDTCPFDPGTVVSNVTGVTGKGFWTNVTLDSKNDDFRGWSATGTVYKNAT
jgi:hypothetical protein